MCWEKVLSQRQHTHAHIYTYTNSIWFVNRQWYTINSTGIQNSEHIFDLSEDQNIWKMQRARWNINDQRSHTHTQTHTQTKKKQSHSLLYKPTIHQQLPLSTDMLLMLVWAPKRRSFLSHFNLNFHLSVLFIWNFPLTLNSWRRASDSQFFIKAFLFEFDDIWIDILSLFLVLFLFFFFNFRLAFIYRIVLLCFQFSLYRHRQLLSMSYMFYIYPCFCQRVPCLTLTRHLRFMQSVFSPFRPLTSGLYLAKLLDVPSHPK